MHVFVTGATGFVGRAVIDELIAAGHTITALARSEGSAAALKAKGVDVLRGSLQDLEILKQGATEADGVINLAMDHDFSKYAENCTAEKSAIEAMGSALIGTNKPLITTSGTLVLTPGEVGTEDSQQVRACVIRLPPTVHGDEDHGFIDKMTALARSQGNAIYIGEGVNCWPAVHRHDAAQLYRLVLENGVAGNMYHAVAEGGVAMKDIADAIGHNLGVPTASKTFAEAQSLDSFLGFVMSVDNPTSSKKTREFLGWEPIGRKLLEDIRAGIYSQE
ncbi:hypothetical protein N7457_008879 [Penicillium paradoxum]|uniref:uncharacterized protein n=1 Tax=Penicillium paradoxum TaxID=176176 RepID=UPI002547CFBB|nr:uncharacterized protein N7457_008879 [Penicillium paradoxum]KAJ5773983.1 hypothetical protein N7457_008879 [Penicillium paradoxum]